MQTPAQDRIECLDGLRGLAALWVVTGHAMILSGWNFPIVDHPEFAVDLFMILSGFLMVYHYQLREVAEPWDSSSTWFAFWCRRFFRIAPVYYLALAAAVSFGPALGDCRSIIDAAIPSATTPLDRYSDQSLGNILAHATFVFGFFPNYAFNSALPDWSIGLEMAFYLIFPFLMLLFVRFGAGSAAVALGIFCLVFIHMFHGFTARFEEPAFIVLKLNMFLAGMLLAYYRRSRPWSLAMAASLAAAMALLPIWSDRVAAAGDLMRLGLVIVFTFIIYGPQLRHTRRVSTAIDRFLGAPLFTHLADLSYSVYLIHLLLMLPIMALLVHYPLAPMFRFAAGYMVTLCIAYGIAVILHLYIERPFIVLGKMFLRVTNARVRVGQRL